MQLISVVISFYGITTSPWRLTLTELYLGYFITNHDFRYIGLLHNLKLLSLDMCLYTDDEDILHLKASESFDKIQLREFDYDMEITIVKRMKKSGQQCYVLIGNDCSVSSNGQLN